MSLCRVDVVFLFWSLFPVFPRIQTVSCLFYSQSNSIGSYFLYSPPPPPPVDQPFLIYFNAFLLVVLWVAVSGIPRFQSFSC